MAASCGRRPGSEYGCRGHLATISYLQAGLVVLMVFAATAMARGGLVLPVPTAPSPGSTEASMPAYELVAITVR